MKKLLFFFSIAITFLLFQNKSVVYAQASPSFDPTQGPTQDTLNDLNPLLIFNSPNAADLSTPGGIVSRVLLFSFPLAGIILFFMLVWGGFEILLGAANKKMLDAGKERITAALVGFLLLFTSYWMTQIIEIVFGLVIL